MGASDAWVWIRVGSWVGRRIEEVNGSNLHCGLVFEKVN